jgi:hypothetical protein
MSLSSIRVRPHLPSKPDLAILATVLVSANWSLLQPIHFVTSPEEGHQNDTNVIATVTSVNDLTKISTHKTISLFARYIHLVCTGRESGDSLGGRTSPPSDQYLKSFKCKMNASPLHFNLINH